MKNRYKLWLAIGPIFCACILVACFFSFDIHFPLSKKEIAYQANARNYSTLKGEYVRNQILSDDHYVPFYSSSEMAIFDEFHPSILAEKYDRNYRPYIAGRDAQGALTHFLEIATTPEGHKGKKVVYLLSPNSFQVPEGIGDQFYQTVHSRQEISHWLLSLETPSEADKYTAKRLLTYKVVQDDRLLAPRLKTIMAGESLSSYDAFRLGLKYRRLRSEDALFSPIKNNRFRAEVIPEKDQLRGMNNFEYARKYKMPHLPEQYNLKVLDELAYDIGKESSSNNDFGFFDLKYEKDIGNNLKKFENYRKNKQYTNSIEYGDFQLVLKEFAELEMDPLIIFIPIDEKWLEFTGTPESETAGLIEKLKYQLNSQGFNNFLVVDGKKEYTHVDAAHAGRRAWVEVDETLNTFLSEPLKETPDYQINDYFLTEEWIQNKVVK